MKAKTSVAGNATKPKNLPESPSVSLEDFLVSMHRASSVVSDSSVFAENGIGLEDWAVLRTISPSTSQRALIAKSMRVPRQRIGRVLSDLEERGFVRLSDAVKGDRRSRTVALTKEGTEALSAVTAKINAVDIRQLERRISRGSKLFRGLLRALPAGRAKREKSE